MTWHDLSGVLLWSAVAALGWGVAAFVLARALGRNNIVDTLWGGGFALIAVVAFATSTGAGDGVRRVVLLVCTLVWSLRLTWFVGRRSAGKGDDQRYVDLLDRHAGTAVTLIFAPQALLLFLVSLTLQVGLVEPGPAGVVTGLGVALWALGLAFEAVGDHQMDRFRADPANHGRLIDEGLWRWTRHPNYFGDAAVWTGLFLVTAERWPGVLTVVSPAVMVYLLAFGSGARLLERSMSRRDGYADYARRTSFFVPVPPGLYRRLAPARGTPLEPRAAGEPRP